ncbi:DUF368 domain-containing protein [Clostridium septicum]|uniref:DUF368 domain-containing protein n=1 Tax=Clostridium septicum TaxID=1504 RepID=A0A9N7PIB2_CLOSE|nr:DUF368 domain-containing protein [Clostridium septicum]AYE33536.1 DUF368 domain-containing protein [Clostridium septicum]MDU1313810.1 DUF368 domain-containing protein [Clostridium septicum]QAS61699.1 DUF368 domain-containing protein [Clostridium septicum]UEC21854.1 DUF368 domain-containing protein [Clostridium septicum]USS00093.1 DUF368 domain-containing protein [Clostridium septicum]
MYIVNFIRGFCMALADSVPGVSGGTIAFILGFYDDFINSLNSLVSIKGGLERKKSSMAFLFKLGIGWVVGMVSSIFLLSSIFDKEIYNISSVFVGFILFSIPIIIREEKDILKENYKNIIYAILGIIVVAAITYFNPTSSGSSSVDLSNISFSLGIYVFVVGMIAISAMVLPGISGSTLLLVFGLYAPIISAVKEFLTFNLSYLPILIIFGFGVLTGIVTTIRLIRYLLKKHRSKMIYFIIGLMIGSFYAVFMGPTTLKVPRPAMNLESFSFIFFIIGGLLIVILEKSKHFLEKRSK